MGFIADKQTLDDLNLINKFSKDSIFSLFNLTRTSGGENLMETMFRNPLTDHISINKRSKIFGFFQQQNFEFPLEDEELAEVIDYLNTKGTLGYLGSVRDILKKFFLKAIGVREEYSREQRRLKLTFQLLRSMKYFLLEVKNADKENLLDSQMNLLESLYQQPQIKKIVDRDMQSEFTLSEMVSQQQHIRSQAKDIASLIELIHELDVYIAVAKVSKANGFAQAVAIIAEDYCLELLEFRYPTLKKAVTNSITIDRNTNVLFLTGANMAGKSTLMKAFGVAIYLAHLGFPVAAKEMKFSVKDGIYSSINLPDNLKMGHSHYYAEVLRVKQVALEVSRGKNLVIIFDELFKGTNVKDAYDATLSVTQAFADYRNCNYIISTHIIEVADALREKQNVKFAFLPTLMKDDKPFYTHSLQEGVTADRHGMKLIINEGILDLLGNKTVGETFF